MFVQRQGLIVWVSDTKAARSLERHGTLHYVSDRMKYAVLYVNRDDLERIVPRLERLHFVKKVEYSLRHEIRTEYTRNIPDKTRFYTL